MSESKYQAKIIKQLEKDGWYVIKLIQTNKNGIPDVIALHRTEGVKLIEFKAKNGKLAPLQKYRIKEIFEKTGILTKVMVEK